MSPLDDELAAALRARAGRVDPLPDPLPGVERRARSLRRRRRTAAALGTAVVAGLLAVAGTTVLGGDGPDRLAPVATAPGPDTAAPGDPRIPVEPPEASTGCCAGGEELPEDGPDLGLTGDDPWAFRGDAEVAAALEERALREWADALPGSGDGVPLRGPVVEPLFATTVPEVGDEALLFLAQQVGQPWEVVLFTVTPDGSSNLDRRPLESGTPVLTRVLAGGEVPSVLVLASPAAGQVDYLPDGEQPAEPLEAGPGWGVYERRVGAQMPDLVHVYDGDGRLVVDTPLRLGCAEGQCGREPVVELGETARSTS